MSRLMLKEIKEIEDETLPYGRCRVKIQLTCNENIYTGEAILDDIEENKLKAVAEATLQAINILLPHTVQMRLVQSGHVALTRPSTAYKAIFFVAIEIKEGLSTQFLSGTCPFTTVTLGTAAGAVLDAVNRKVEKYIST